MKSVRVFAVLIGLTFSLLAQEPDPMRHCNGTMRRGVLQNFNGEASAWHAAYVAEDFVDGYEAYGKIVWLDAAQKYFDFLLSKLTKDPDGYEGWIGQTIGKTQAIRSDALVGDAILLAPMVRFSEVVLKDKALQAKYGAAAKRYQEMAHRIIWEKWNKRGCYYEDDMGFGSYHTNPKMIDAKTGKWIDRSSTVVSDNLNKHYAAGVVILRLWRLDPRPEYKKRIVSIFSRAKFMFRYFRSEDRVVWNFWMPHGPHDIQGTAPKSWVAVHPNRPGYQAGEVKDWVEVYDSGLVFDKRDLQLMIRTNHWMAANGPKNKMGFTNADGSKPAGTLWGALARFDKQIRDRLQQRVNRGRNQTAKAYFQNVTMKQLGWERRLMRPGQKPEVSRIPIQDGRYLSMAQVIPTSVETVNNSKVKFVTQTRADGTLKIELLSKDMKTVLGTLHQGNAGNGYHAPRWDGTNPKTGKKEVGEYRIRWTLNDETRISKVWVKVGTKRKKAGPGVLAKGESFKENFDGQLSKRWRLEGASVSSEKAVSGKSLKLTNGHSAVLKIGEDESLPVRIKLKVFDAGKKRGKSTGNGPMWGVQMGNGSNFVLRQVWRRYLNGDAYYCWLNNGENQYFSPHPAGVDRKAGWSDWVFDLTKPSSPVITCNGKAVRGLNVKYQPDGAVALVLSGGDRASGPLYVDDIVVEYP